MKHLSFRRQLRICLGLFFLCIISKTNAQELYVGDGGSFYLGNGIDFTTSNTVVEKADTGTFAIAGGVSWSEPSEYVNGEILVLGSGTTVVNIGDIDQSTVTISTGTDDAILCNYTRSEPTGNLDATLFNYVLSDTEYWTITKTAGSSSDVSVAALSPAANATYGGAVANAPILVRYNGSVWEAYSGSLGFGDFAYASLVETLGTVNEAIAQNFVIYPNPVASIEQQLFVSWSGSREPVALALYDVSGRLVHTEKQIITTGKHKIDLPKLEAGAYLLHTRFTALQKTITKRIIIN